MSLAAPSTLYSVPSTEQELRPSNDALLRPLTSDLRLRLCYDPDLDFARGFYPFTEDSPMSTARRTDAPSRRPLTELMDRQPPFDLQAEIGVLGSIVLLPDVLDDV